MPNFWLKEDTFLLMFDCVGKDFANNKPRCLIISKEIIVSLE
jgi:hypothetical protein